MSASGQIVSQPVVGAAHSTSDPLGTSDFGAIGDDAERVGSYRPPRMSLEQINIPGYWLT